MLSLLPLPLSLSLHSVHCVSLMPKYRSTTCTVGVKRSTNEDEASKRKRKNEKKKRTCRRWVYQCNGNDAGCHFPCLSTHTHTQSASVCVCANIVNCLDGCRRCRRRSRKTVELLNKNNLHNMSTKKNAYTPRYHQWKNLWATLSAFTNILVHLSWTWSRRRRRRRHSNWILCRDSWQQLLRCAARQFRNFNSAKAAAFFWLEIGSKVEHAARWPQQLLL